jgi:antibiotic biosynthesis monooxygenase (ABM) superfamily enzyme
MRRPFIEAARILAGVLLGVSLSAGDHQAGQNKFGQPKTVIHVVSIRWNPGVAESDKARVIDGVKEMAAKIPGIRNVWIESDRVQPNDFNAVFAIEFENRATADAYSESPAHKIWKEQYLPLRASSVSIQVSNR